MRRTYTGSNNPFFGRKHSEATIEKIREARKLQVGTNKGMTWKISNEARLKRKGSRTGLKNPRWISNRSLIKRQEDRNNPEYKQWRKSVWLRDNFKCKIVNPDCKGKIEAHHILAWRDYPEFRYQTNNGITLCHAHHPRVRAEEKRLIPEFQQLVSVSSEILWQHK